MKSLIDCRLKSSNWSCPDFFWAEDKTSTLRMLDVMAWTEKREEHLKVFTEDLIAFGGTNLILFYYFMVQHDIECWGFPW